MFFEGDIGQIYAGLNDMKNFDLPVAFGLMPYLTQNGVWMEDAFIGGAISLAERAAQNMTLQTWISPSSVVDKVTNVFVNADGRLNDDDEHL